MAGYTKSWKVGTWCTSHLVPSLPSVEASLASRAWNEGYPKVREDFTFTVKAPTRAFSWLKAGQCQFSIVSYNSDLNVKAVVAFNQENALVGAFSEIANLLMDLRFKL